MSKAPSSKRRPSRSAEFGRKRAEVRRGEQERQRLTAETGRARAEVARVAAESRRTRDEGLRRVSESARRIAEAARTRAEEARTQAISALAIANRARRELVDLLEAVREQRLILNEMLESAARFSPRPKPRAATPPRAEARRAAASRRRG